MKFKNIIFFFLAVILMTSCNSYKNIGYLKGVEDIPAEQLQAAKETYSPKIKPGDILLITVNTLNPAISLPFNQPLIPTATGAGNVTQALGTQTYMVDNEGNIMFPVLGKLHIAGMERTELEKFIRNKIYLEYMTEDPIVNVRFTNFSVSVLGEVNRPGTYIFESEKVNILDALAQAGDLTIYGKRKEVLLVRENPDGSNQYTRLDLQDKELVLSPYFYLQQNDKIYVEPNKARGNSSSIGTTETLTISLVSTLITIANLVVNLSK